MAERIKRRDDVNPEREASTSTATSTFADPMNKKYPIDSPEHVRAAWGYINHANNAAKYTKDEVSTIKGRIKRAARRRTASRSARADHQLRSVSLCFLLLV